ncbi:MAG TPA: hypothetical protein VI544_02155, partial [Candidatus Nanoarchaeia archaeon]|nr:hypothetical protein [Candidatus Nanoarchaeia archaeon]
KVNLAKKQNAEESANETYLIINYPKDSIKFLGDYSEKTVGSGTYVLVADSTTIEFIVSDYVSISSLGMYLSPQISKVLEFSSVLLAEKGSFKWGRFIFWMLILLIIAFAAYIALQEWYKRRYESYLFKNPVEVYNIITFMHNSRKNNLEDSETVKKLKNAGWKGEQISYAFNKLEGKRTGMWEIPIFSYLEQRKIKNEIEKRRVAQQQSQDSKQPQTKPLLK